jgi:CRP-like cAMP-binding protein
VGCSRVTVARVLKSFLDEGLIEKVNRKIVIRDMKTLAGYTDRLQ